MSDHDEDCLKVFDEELGFAYEFGERGDEAGEFCRPNCLSLNKAGQLMVCDSCNHRVQVFEMSGRFVTTFGGRGRGYGKFDSPCSIAVLSDGKIVVSDVGNHRIQIFE